MVSTSAKEKNLGRVESIDLYVSNPGEVIVRFEKGKVHYSGIPYAMLYKRLDRPAQA